MKPGIYIHIPFCLKKCLYCDFYSVTDASLQGPFAGALLKEIEAAESISDLPDSLYIGGGTPSILDPLVITAILSAVKRRFRLPDDAEVTLEANPGTVTLEKLRAYRKAGVNRLNIGVQAFDDAALSFLGRCHDAREAREAVLWARMAGFDNIGLDLIHGLPGRSIRQWRETLVEGLSFYPEHLSCYMLTYETGTPLDRLRETGSIDPVGEDIAAALFFETMDVLLSAGYEHYEISNFARSPGFRSRHNQKYWHHAPYLGFGPAAHSFSGKTRQWNIKDVAVYIRRMEEGLSPREDSETLTRRQLMIETVYLGFRTRDGIDLKRFEEIFGTSFRDMFFPLLQSLTAEKLLELTESNCTLTPRGLLFHDHVTGRFVDEME